MNSTTLPAAAHMAEVTAELVNQAVANLCPGTTHEDTLVLIRHVAVIAAMRQVVGADTSPTPERLLLSGVARPVVAPLGLPDGLGYGEVKNCYGNSVTIALTDDEQRYTYTEGYAYRQGVIPVQHAWLTDRDGSVYDPTWKPRDDSNEAVYLGIRFSHTFMLDWLKRTNYFPAVLASDHPALGDLLDNGLVYSMLGAATSIRTSPPPDGLTL